MPAPHGILILQDPDGLVFQPRERIALIMDEHAGRLTFVDADGQVAHRPGPLDNFAQPPFHTVAPGVLAHPAHARRSGKSLSFPGGWTFPVPAGWTRSPGPSDPPSGAVVKVGKLSIDLRHLRRFRVDARKAYFTFDDNRQSIATLAAGQAFANALGLAQPHHLDPFPEAHRWMYRLRLRDWPKELLQASARELRAWFGQDEKTAIANVIWQVFRWGRRLDYGRDHRAFWYLPLFPILVRLGYTRRLGGDDLVSLDAVDESMQLMYVRAGDEHYLRFQNLLSLMVGEARLITYEAINFQEPRPDMHAVGTTRPEIFLLAEKSSLSEYTRAIAAKFGVSWCVLGGEPSYCVTEFIAKALLGSGVRTIRLIAYTDFDPDGWIIPRSFAEKLDRYGVKTQDTGHLVRPSRFTKHELEYLGEPLPAPNPGERTKILDWLKASGGIGGRGIGIHADHLRPLERVVAAFVEEAGIQ